MIYFYELIAQGVDKKRIPKSFSHAVAQLEEMNVLQINDGHITLKPNLHICVVESSTKNKAVLKHFKGDSRKGSLCYGANGVILRKGDVVLAKDGHKKRLRFITLLYRVKSHILAALVEDKEHIKAVELGVKSTKPTYITLKVSQKALRALPKHCVVKVEIASGDIVEVLGVLESAHIDEKIALANVHLHDFSATALQNARAFSDRISKDMYPHRTDLSHLPFCVIDPANAHDHDDAIYFDSKNRALYVAIADVSEYVGMESELDKEAKKRGFSIYFPHKVIPMLPYELSHGICSLRANELALAFTWKITFNKAAQVISSELLEALIMPKANVSYDDVNAFLQGADNILPKSIQKWLKAFIPYVKKCKARRLIDGYEFAQRDITLTLNSDGEVSHWERLHHTLAHSIIEESMLLANMQSAQYLQNNAPKALYRIHPKPKSERIKTLFWELNNMGFSIASSADLHTHIAQIQAQCTDQRQREMIDSIIIQSFAKATYSTHNIGHFGLGCEAYAHFTSPIRRYNDIIIHRILKALLHKAKTIHFLMQSLDGVAEALNAKERQIQYIEHTFYRLKMLRLCANLLKTQGSVVCRAIVIDNQSCIAIDVIPQMKILLDVCVERLSLVDVEITRVDILCGVIYAKVLHIRQWA